MVESIRFYDMTKCARVAKIVTSWCQIVVAMEKLEIFIGMWPGTSKNSA